MASSFAEKVLKATALKAKGRQSSSPTRRSSASGATSRTSSTASSSLKYAAKGSMPDRATPLLTANIPSFVFSSKKILGSGPDSSDPARSPNRRRSRRSSAGDLVLRTAPPYAVRQASRLLESPYGKEFSFERSPRRRSSFAASLQNPSVAFSTPVVNPSPQVSKLGSSPSPDFADIPGISSSPVLGDEESSRSENQNSGSSDNNTSQAGKPQQLGETATNNATTSRSPTSSIPAFPVGEAFTSLLPGSVSVMANRLYPNISSPESLSPPASAPHIDGFNIPAVGMNLPNAPSNMSPTSKEEEISPLESAAAFLQKRKAAAATQRQKGIMAIDPNSVASKSIVKRRTQVLSTVQKAKTRLSVLSYEVTRKRRSFKNNYFGRFRRWLYERERKRMMGKGAVANKLWLVSLKEMEVSYGSPMMVAFSFIRWVFLLNAFLAVLWLCLIIIPFMAHPPNTFSWKLFWTTLGDKKAVKETFQGSNLEKTFVYYGGYTYTRPEQRGWYRVDYMYAVMIAATFLFSFICVLVRISRTIMSRGDIAVAARLYPFSSLVFASWDFHLTNADVICMLSSRKSLLRESALKSTNSVLGSAAEIIRDVPSMSLRRRCERHRKAHPDETPCSRMDWLSFGNLHSQHDNSFKPFDRNLHKCKISSTNFSCVDGKSQERAEETAGSKLRRGIRMQLKEMLADVLPHEKTSSLRDRLMSAKRATALFILWPLLMAANVAIVLELVTKAEQVNNAFGSNYAQALLLSILNIVTPMIIRILVDMENFRPATAERVVLIKLFCVRVLNLTSLYYRLFMMLEHTLQVREDKVVIEACQDGDRCYEGFTCCTTTNMTQWNICTDRDIQFCLPACTENAVGIQLLRLIVMTTLINNAYELIYGFGYVWATSGNKRQLFIEDMAIDVVYVQSLVWVGSCFSPMATILGFFANLLTWYGMRFALFRTCGPVEKAHSASRAESLTYGLLLLTLILSTIPATLNVMQRGSGFCGPIHDRVSQYTVLTSYMKLAPQGLWLTVQWLTNPAVLLGVILLLVFGVVLLQSKLVQSRQFLALTKHEMGMQRREASERLTRVRQNTLQNESSPSGPDAKIGLPPGPLRRSSVPSEVPASLGQVEAFLFSLANEGQEPPPGGQGRSSVLQTTRRRSNQVKAQTPRPSLLHEEKSPRAPEASLQRTSVICTLLERVSVICGIQMPRSGRIPRTFWPADGSSKTLSEDEIRAPVALIRGFKVPPDAKIAASAPSIWSILTPLSGSSIWGSLSSDTASTARTSVSLSGPGGASDAMMTARTSLSSPAAGWPRESSVKASFSAASAISKLLWAVSGSPDHRPSLPEVESAELQNAATPLRSRTSFESSNAEVGLVPSAVSSMLSRAFVSVRAGTSKSSDTNSPTAASKQGNNKRPTVATRVSWLRRILGRSKRKSALRRLSRMSVIAGSRTSSPRRSGTGSGYVSPVITANGITQWLARAAEGSTWGSRPRSPRESINESLSTPRGEAGVDNGLA